jgi:hypothetical protein
MKSILLLFSALMLLLSSSSIFSQEKWSRDPRMTAIYPSGTYVPLPQYKDNIITEHKATRVFHTPVGTLLVNPNLRVHPDAGATQSEVTLVKNGQIPNTMFGSANTVWPPGGFSGISEGVYLTTDGGTSWFGWDTVHSTPITGHGGDPGPVIDKNGTLIMTHLGYPTSGMFANYSTDMGQTWSNTYTIASGSQDKNLAGTDDSPSSPYYGRSYVVWSWFSVSSPYIAVSYTTNGGVSWSSSAQINNPPSGHYSQGCDIRTAANGDVYVTWAAPSSGTLTEDYDGFAKSTNGGVAWSVTENAFDANGIRGYLNTKNNIRVNSFPRIDVDRSGGPFNGRIYIVGCDKNLAPAGSDPDIVIHWSTNGGASWSSAVRVNQDPLNNGAIQYFPAVRVDEFGGVNVVYYDDRNVGGSQVQVYVSRSIDGGSTWTDIQVSDHAFSPMPISGLAGGYQGDYIGISSSNNKVFPFWMDNSTGGNLYQAWTTTIDLGPSIVHTPLPNTENLTGPYAVNCVITPAGSPINPAATKMLWSRNNPSITDSVLMTNTSGNNWTANIPGNGSPATYRYYIKTADNLGRTATAPPGAPAVLYSFVASADTVKPVIIHTPITTLAQVYWPATINAVVTDNIGVDSVWVEWYKNSPTPIKEFRLIHTSGNNYSAPFNSANNEVAIGDSVFYVIKARDISSNHNLAQLPTSGYFKIMIIAGYPLPPYCLCDNTTYTPITGSSGPSGDDITQTVPVGFTFSFMGHSFTTVSVCTNGFVVLGSSTFNGYTNDLCGTLAGENPMFAPFWDDLNTLNGGNIQYTTQGTAPNRVFIVQFTNVAYFSGSGNVTFQLRMYETSNKVEFIYGPATSNPSASGSVGETDTLGGSGRVYSITPGSDCPSTTYSQSSCNNSIAYNTANFASGRRFTFNCPVGINPITQGVPREYTLEQNYPNPFNPTTTIKYSIPKAGIVRLIVYDVLGREVKQLVSEMKAPGNYEITFQGENYASGVYFYRLEAGDFTSVKKMVLVK